MPAFGAKNNLLRSRDEPEDGRVTFVELFFDLVFVYAVTQLSHTLLEHLSVVGFAQTMLLFMAVWWVWIDTSWVTNWLDPQTTAVRLMLFALMLAGLILSISIPQAFDGGGKSFALAYAFMQIGRGVFMLWSLRHHHAGNFRNFQRILCWHGLAALVWVAGAWTDPDTRLLVWTGALAIEFLSPAIGFWVPGLGRSTSADWDVEGSHMAERCGLFIIIALGESILVTGGAFAKTDMSAPVVAAFAAAFVGSVAMWWIYFNVGAEKARQRITHTDNPGRLARLAYTYLHIPVVAGIVVCAVADELILAHPTGQADARTLLVLLGGPALYLAGTIAFKRAIWGRMPLSHLVGLGLLTGLGAAAPFLAPLAVGAATMSILVMVAIWEARSLGGKKMLKQEHD